jgi:HD-like signal output (HDOD) protein
MGAASGDFRRQAASTPHSKTDHPSINDVAKVINSDPQLATD